MLGYCHMQSLTIINSSTSTFHHYLKHIYLHLYHNIKSSTSTSTLPLLPLLLPFLLSAANQTKQSKR